MRRIRVRYPGRNEKQSTFLRAQSAPVVKMIIATYVPPSECSTPEGTQTAIMSIWNKHDYAHWHKYMFRLETTTADPTLRPRGSPDVPPPLPPPFPPLPICGVGSYISRRAQVDTIHLEAIAVPKRPLMLRCPPPPDLPFPLAPCNRQMPGHCTSEKHKRSQHTDGRGGTACIYRIRRILVCLLPGHFLK